MRDCDEIWISGMTATFMDHALYIQRGPSVSSLSDIESIAQGASDRAYKVPTQAVPELLEALQSVRLSVGGMFKYIPFNDNAVFWQCLDCEIKPACGSFKYRYFYPENKLCNRINLWHHVNPNFIFNFWLMSVEVFVK